MEWETNIGACKSSFCYELKKVKNRRRNRDEIIAVVKPPPWVLIVCTVPFGVAMIGVIQGVTEENTAFLLKSIICANLLAIPIIMYEMHRTVAYKERIIVRRPFKRTYVVTWNKLQNIKTMQDKIGELNYVFIFEDQEIRLNMLSRNVEEFLGWALLEMERKNTL